MRHIHTTLLCGLLLTGTAATAQRSSSTPEARLAASIPAALRPYLRYTAIARQAGARAATPPTAKTTAMRERLTGYSFYDDLGELTDSARFTYSGTRGSVHGANDIASYTFNYDPFNEHLPKTGGVTVYGTSGPLNILCDTGVLIGGDLLPYQTMAMQYSAANRLQRFRSYAYVAGTAVSFGQYRYTYNGAGQVTLLEEDDAASGGGVPVPYSQIYSRYGGTGKILLDSAVYSDGDPTSKIDYTYNTAGLLTNLTVSEETSPGVYEVQVTVDYTHDMAGRFRNSTISADLGGTGTLEPFLKDSLGYTGTYPFPTFIRLLQDDGSSFVPAVEFVYHVNSAGLRDTLTFFDYTTGSPEESGKTWYTYTAGGNLKTSQSTDAAGSAPEVETYYYQAYDDAAAIPTAPVQAIAATAYPNPVTFALTLRWDAFAAGAHLKIILIDAAGRTLLVQSSATATGKAEVDMSRYAPGLYTVMLSDADGTPLQSLKVTKQ